MQFPRFQRVLIIINGQEGVLNISLIEIFETKTHFDKTGWQESFENHLENTLKGVVELERAVSQIS